MVRFFASSSFWLIFYGAALLVYILPLLLLLLGFTVATLLKLSEGAAIALSFLGLLIGAAVIVLSQRRKSKGKEITFTIIALI